LLGACPSSGDVFFFDYGTVVFWGLSAADEQAVLAAAVAPAKRGALDPADVEVDEFESQVGPASVAAHIQNDVITLPPALATGTETQLAIAHALAQSTKLGVYEARLGKVVEATRSLPEHLAATGRVPISRSAIARLMGEVFLQKSAVNLLSG
jgi:uncharacterized Rmd1/YagE family protein